MWRKCAYCGGRANGDFQLERDWPVGDNHEGDCPLIDLCEECGGGVSPSLAQIWLRTSQIPCPAGEGQDGVYAAIVTPQAWVNDHAVAVDPPCLGDGVIAPCEWDCSADVNTDQRVLDETQHTLRDQLARSAAAPAWMQNWPGPFDVRIKTVREPRRA